MLKYYKSTEETSNAAKRGWVNFRKDEKKFQEWLEKRSEYMSSLSSEEQRRRANIFWENITEKEYISFCNKMKAIWDDGHRKKVSESMIKYYSNSANREKKSLETKKVWESRSEKEREDFKNKMDIVNKNEEKRKKAGDKLKLLWKDEAFLTKMKNRKKNPGKKMLIIFEDKREEILNMTEITKKYDFSAKKIRKYRDTGNKIKESELKDNFLLKNAIINTWQE